MANICSVTLPLASARYCAADEGVAEKCEKPGVEGLYGAGDDPLLRHRMENAGQIGFESGEQGIGSTGIDHVCDSVFVTGCAVSRWACSGLAIEGVPPEMSTRMKALTFRLLIEF
jgi:hypothetical protein